MIEKGTKWIAQIRRIAKAAWEITPKYARWLYISVALPRIMYAIDLWCAPSQSKHLGTGTAKVMRQMTTLQRAGTTAITGGLCTSPTDALDTCTYLLPVPQNIDKWCHKSTTRLTTLPLDHPLYKTIKKKNTRNTKHHCTAIHYLLNHYNLDPNKIEKIPTSSQNLVHTGKTPFKISIPTERRKQKTQMKKYKSTQTDQPSKVK
jgi:hypothetical protein